MVTALNYNPTTKSIKFMCSYGGRILPRYTDGKLRYHGGHTRVLSLDRSVTFSELVAKLSEMCGTKLVSLRCQLPDEDLDALVTIKSDEDLANIIEEYDRCFTTLSTPPHQSSIKIRAFLSTKKSCVNSSSSQLSSASSSTSSNEDSTSSPISAKLVAISSTTKPPIYPSSSSSSGKHRNIINHARSKVLW